MPNDTLFGVHAAALEVRSKRMGLLASNIANVSTPGFKAKDIDFQTALAAVEQTGNPASLDGALQYRVPLQPSLDRSEEHTSELQSLMRISYAVFCLKKKNSNEH